MSLYDLQLEVENLLAFAIKSLFLNFGTEHLKYLKQFTTNVLCLLFFSYTDQVAKYHIEQPASLFSMYNGFIFKNWLQCQLLT